MNAEWRHGWRAHVLVVSTSFVGMVVATLTWAWLGVAVAVGLCASFWTGPARVELSEDAWEAMERLRDKLTEVLDERDAREKMP